MYFILKKTVETLMLAGIKKKQNTNKPKEQYIDNKPFNQFYSETSSSDSVSPLASLII